MIDVIQVDQAHDRDRLAILDVNLSAWEVAYAHIYTRQEMHDLFERRIQQRCSWAHHRKEHLPVRVTRSDEVVNAFVGMALLHQPCAGEITSFYVHPDYQRQGYGIALWQTALQTLSNYGCQVVWVWALERAKQAVQFYQQRGASISDYGIYEVGTHKEIALGLQVTLT